MYEPFMRTTGADASAQLLSQFKTVPKPDGLVTVEGANSVLAKDVAIPDGLREWLLGLRVLRNVPIAYFVPDAALLPPESIRFFHVDMTWLDRLIDGVFSTTNIGTADMLANCVLAKLVRQNLDAELLDKNQAGGMSGMLIRSELVRRWPDMVVGAWAGKSELSVARAEPISKDLYIALFVGVPDLVTLGEPFVGARYGVDAEIGANKQPTGKYEVIKRRPDGSRDTGTPPGSQPNQKVPVGWRDNDAARRVLDIGALGKQVAPAQHARRRMLALHLQQPCYTQTFRMPAGVSADKAEQKGSVAPARNPDGTLPVIPLRNGRLSMRLDKLNARYEAQQKANSSKPTS